ncbi:hypothetical protein SAMN04488033_12241 [Salegentibacter agarivorans]|uniref:Uncharacterized protein n=1 Tax=Salegentibacter agarivorans TaxID=345907 RepID=A0A1I2NLA9_9FLAO|nr:hypothetical protein [Salegentibacter agarivorans]SFG03810.1 hypothetical protein SAMN04488033_12241 [Salegentibacter agarivorans]
MGWIGELRDLISWIGSRKKKEQKIANRKVSSISAPKVYNDFQLYPNKHKYRDYKVKWHCDFMKLDSSLVFNQVHLNSSGVNIHSKVSLDNYPELKNEKEGKKYIITGIIEKTEKDGIYLSKLIELKEDTFFII